MARAKPHAALTREVEAATKRFMALPPGEQADAALKDLKAAECHLRAARRAEGENLISEEARAIPATLGFLEDLIDPLRDRIRKLEARKR